MTDVADSLIREALQHGLPGIGKAEHIPDGNADKRYEDKLAMDIHGYVGKDSPHQDLVAHLKAHGHDVSGTDIYHAGYGSSYYGDESIFEHPDVTQHNAEMMSQERTLGRRGRGGQILNTYSANLYRRRADVPETVAGEHKPKYIFHVGRLGNSRVIGINGPKS